MNTLCPATDELTGLVEGRLDADAANRLHDHLRDCPDCRFVLGGLAEPEEEIPDDRPLRAGQSVGRFVLTRLLGLGGMGAVWAANDPELGREVAVKLLRVGVGSDADQALSSKRLRTEARAMAHLAHPNVVPVFEVGEMRDRLFVVLEKVEGETLGQWLQEERTLDQIVDAFLGAGRGLAAAHHAGIIHRDFKPENVLMGKDGRPRVTDFGLARRAQSDDSLPPVGPTLAQMLARPDEQTPLGALLGTPAYMAPEQMRGVRADARSDLFAFCTAFYEAVAGTRPYVGKSFAELRARAEQEKIEPPRRPLPSWLGRVLRRGLKADPLERYPSMDELLAAIEKERRGPRRIWLAGLAAALAALAIALLARPQKAGPRQAVAVLDPRDAAPGAGSAFISGALGELLEDELAAHPHLRLVPAELVQPALADLGIARGAPIDGPTADRIQRRLGADLVLGGSYELEGGHLHAVVELWRRDRGRIAAIDESGPADALVPIAGRLGARLRAELGDSESQPPRRTQGSFPANPEAARLYVTGLSRLRSYEPGAAIESLQAAGRLESGNPRIDAALTEAFLDLDRARPAREAAARAMNRIDELPPDDRARFEILRARALPDKEAAIRLARAYWRQAPDELERGLSLARLQITLLRKPAEALATVAELRKLPPPAGTDPRIDVLEAQARNQAGDLRQSVAIAEHGYAGARTLGARRVMAQARHFGANSLRQLGSDPARARAMYREAETLYRQVNDLVGAAVTDSMQAALLADGGDLAGARAQMESAFTTYGDLGDRIGEAAALHNLAIILRRMRDLPGALKRAQQAYAIQLELDERRSQANTLSLLGHLRQDVGDLSGASAALSESVRIRRETKDPLLVASLTNLGLIEMAQGDLAAARRTCAEAEALGTQEKPHLAELRSAIGQIDFGEGKYAEAEAAFREAAALTTAANHVDEAALAEALLAGTLLAGHKTAEAREAVTRATALLTKSKTGIARGTLNVVSARVKAAETPGDPSVVGSLRAALAEAAASGVADDQWAARLALAELEPAESRAVVRARLRALANQARAQGYGYYALLAESAARR